MKKSLTVLVLLLCAATPALAGKNAGGALIVHANDYVQCYRETTCCYEFDDPGSCEAADTEIDQTGELAVIWFLAAFDASTNPVVTGCRLGNDHNFPPGEDWFWYWRPCPHEWGGTEVADVGWPEYPSSAGTSLTFDLPIAGSHLFPVYYFICTWFEGAYLGSSIHPNLGYTAFLDDSNPPLLDGTTRFGQVRYLEPGFNDCPPPPSEVVACCFDVGDCVYLTEGECLQLGGTSQGPGSVCDPNPCTQPDAAACCLPTGTCFLSLPYDCAQQGGDYLGAGTSCDPNPCVQPPDGACCLPSGSCVWIDQYQCTDQAGQFLGPDQSCDPNPCVQPPDGSCCLEGGGCVVNSLYECADLGGEFFAEGQPCDPSPCPQACCLPSGSCVVVYPPVCETIGGTSQGGGILCDPNPCGTTDVEDAMTIPVTWGRVKALYR